MSETAEQKTKRKYAEALRAHKFSYQTCIFFPIKESRETNTQAASLLRDILRKNYKFPILWKLKHIHPKSSVIDYYEQHYGMEVTSHDWQAYVSIYSTEKLKGLAQILTASGINTIFATGIPAAMMSRFISKDALEHKVLAEANKKAKPHDLQISYAGDRIRRWGFINKPE